MLTTQKGEWKVTAADGITEKPSLLYCTVLVFLVFEKDLRLCQVNYYTENTFDTEIGCEG